MRTRPFRFNIGIGRPVDAATLVATALRAEELGYSTVSMPDHLMVPFAPLIALQAVADATTTLRLTPSVLANDFRRPAVLAKELATLDVLSGGRLQVGIGAAWMQKEFGQAGIPFDKASVRIERLEEAFVVLKGLFGDEPFSFAGKHFTITGLDGTPKPTQRPHPPIMLGGGGPKVLAVAGRQADVALVMTRIPAGSVHEYTAGSFRDKVGWVKDAAGDRFDDIELGTQLMLCKVTDDPDAAVEAFIVGFSPVSAPIAGGMTLTKEELLSSPLFAVGSLEHICDKLRETRETYGFSYISAPVGSKPEDLAPVVEQLAGT